MANLLHQTGRKTEALEAFRHAEEMLREQEPHAEFLYSIQGYWYCDLLLAEDRIQEVRTRSESALTTAKKYGNLLGIALANLLLGQAALREDQKLCNVNLDQAEDYLQDAITGLRRAGIMGELPKGLLARAVFYRLKYDFLNAERDLAEVQRIARRCQMGLHLADYHLESARLCLAQNSTVKLRKHLLTATEMINRMGYHRRDKEVAELEVQLA